MFTNVPAIVEVEETAVSRLNFTSGSAVLYGSPKDTVSFQQSTDLFRHH